MVALNISLFKVLSVWRCVFRPGAHLSVGPLLPYPGYLGHLPHSNEQVVFGPLLPYPDYLELLLPLLHWAGCALWTSAALPWLPGTAPPSAPLSRVCSLDLCCPTLITWNCPSLCSTEQGVLFAPFAHKSTGQNSALSSVGPSVWNGLSFALRLLPWFQSDTFYSSLKNVLLVVLGSGALLSGSLDEVLCKSL